MSVDVLVGECPGRGKALCELCGGPVLAVKARFPSVAGGYVPAFEQEARQGEHHVLHYEDLNGARRQHAVVDADVPFSTVHPYARAAQRPGPADGSVNGQDQAKPEPCHVLGALVEARVTDVGHPLEGDARNVGVQMAGELTRIPDPARVPRRCGSGRLHGGLRPCRRCNGKRGRDDDGARRSTQLQ